MKTFFKTVFASALGFCVGTVVLSIVLFFVFLGIVAGIDGSKTYTPQKDEVLKLELTGSLNDRVMEDPLSLLLGEMSKQQSLTDVLNAIAKAKENDHIKGIYIKNDPSFSAGISSVSAIRRALKDFKESGKFLVAYGDAYTQSCYYVSSVADKVFLNSHGMLSLHGLASSRTFYKGLFEKLGVKMEIFKVGTFKSAVEPYMLDKMSDANKEQLTSYLGSIWKNVSADISIDRHLSVDSLNILINSGIPFLPVEQVLEAGLVDSLVYLPEVEDYLKTLLGVDDVHFSLVQDLKYLPFKDAKTYDDKIAVLFAEGEITTALSGFATAGTIISDKEYVKELKKLKEDDDVKAVVFRINSPGGSGFISEQIWHEVIALKEKKPVIVSMGDVAASGGYYIACAADWIVAEPTTITGSIGVFGMFPTFEGLYGKVGLSSDVVKTHIFADFGETSRDMRADEKVLVQQYINRFYDVFLTRCSEGRHKSKAAIDSIGQGRVWTGEQALSIGLVDELGDLDRAIEIAAEKSGLKNFSRVDYPKDKNLLTSLTENISGDIKLKIAKGLLDEVEFRHLMMIKNIKQQDVVQARLPFE